MTASSKSRTPVQLEDLRPGQHVEGLRLLEVRRAQPGGEHARGRGEPEPATVLPEPADQLRGVLEGRDRRGAGRDVPARPLRRPDPALFLQRVQRLAERDPADAEALAEVAFGGEAGAGGEDPCGEGVGDRVAGLYVHGQADRRFPAAPHRRGGVP
ncbi:hypothetical protein NC490_24990 [Streptomyces sp. G1]|nr:hypothetical protein [Streptomyces sp. G1]MCM1969573.1 hypothetical protein [Streptomyces sp. G1]